MLKKEFRINRKRDYDNIYKNGRKILGRYMVLFFLKKTTGFTRYGIVTSKKLGHAVNRNLAKRRLRAIIYSNMDKYGGPYDIVIVARNTINSASFEDISRDYHNIMRKSAQ